MGRGLEASSHSRTFPTYNHTRPNSPAHSSDHPRLKKQIQYRTPPTPHSSCTPVASSKVPKPADRCLSRPIAAYHGQSLPDSNSLCFTIKQDRCLSRRITKLTLSLPITAAGIGRKPKSAYGKTVAFSRNQNLRTGNLLQFLKIQNQNLRMGENSNIF